MNKTCTYLIVVIIALICNASTAMADSTGLVKFNLDNGLPSNHIYCVHIDKKGYLWIGTDNGVVKYDGYSFKIFNTSNGLPSNDVWQFFEDGMGRLWLGMYANELGYIKNDQYHKLPYSSDDPVKLIKLAYAGNTTYIRIAHPTLIVIDSSDNIMQFNYFGIEKYGIGIMQLGTHNIYPLMFIRPDKHGNPVYKTRYTYSLRNGTIKQHAEPFIDGESEDIISDSVLLYVLAAENLYYISKIKSDSVIKFNNVFEKEERGYVHIIDQHIDIITNRYWYIILPQNNTYIKKDFRKILGRNDIQLTNVTQDRLQNEWFSTDKGLYYKNKKKNLSASLTSKNELNGYRYAGYTNSKKTIWWNMQDLTLLLLGTDNNIILKNNLKTQWPGFTIGNDTAVFIETITGITKWNMRTNSLIQVATLNSKLSGFIRVNDTSSFFRHNISTIPYGSYLFESSAVSKLAITYIEKDSLYRRQLDAQRYDKALYDTVNQLLWYYNNNAIAIVDPVTQKHQAVGKSVIDRLGLNNISSLNINTFGNLFIHHADKLSVFNTHTRRFSRVHTNIKLSNAFVAVSGNNLLVANESGIAIAQIKGEMKIGEFRIALNPKDLCYRKVNNFVVNGDGIILQTDKGTYSTTVSELLRNDLLTVSDKRLMQLVVHTPDAYNLNRTDTISINDSTDQIRLDMINLYGKGIKSYFYNIDNTGWQNSSSGEIFSPAMKPGYHTIRCYGTDELWKSNINTFWLYKQPYWYQTSKWKAIFWISGIIIFLGIVLIAVLITRYLVQRANDKKRQTLELELRAIHSQINPHFIFNTLGTALFFISKRKLDEAYQHVHKFSRLLRSYLKASHDRYTLLSEEIEMLRNYIELQQIRFEEKVDYSIEVDNKIPVGSIMVPSLLFQPLVENAINHGLFHLEDGKKGKLDIIFKSGKYNNELICSIEDNGIGRKRAKELREQSEIKRDSYGTKLTQDLIDIFKEYERMDIYIEYTDKQAPETGTIVTLIIRNLKYVA